ncbi:ATP-binding protein [Paenibacillus sp. 1011MAR3C5]|uniref:AAA family ATPase n=1 Tax=Paenibacillus sp. 1011MAR3C5 TaxID=1675787 RepID=UPI000E6BD71A|nr:AAA family ATPase [Paenibacillus sp. 1011MAR3C5]RJE86281.1 ATP-binding protein [Paenibacillus sp. 1011MAR3C5]
MSRLVIITVGKTHSGKTTFAKALEQQLQDALVIDQDNHAEFINTYYQSLLPKQGPNRIKFAMTQTIVEYAIHQTGLHLILCNSNRNRKDRLKLLSKFHNEEFISILVHFDLADDIIQARVANSTRSTAIFRSASSFEEVLLRQQAESVNDADHTPQADEANYLFVVKEPYDVQSVIQRIVAISRKE